MMEHLKIEKDHVFLYQIKRCSGPCVDYIDKDDYKKSVRSSNSVCVRKIKRYSKKSF